MSNKILILGASGFIGKNLALFFSKKTKIIAIYKTKIPFINKNIKWIKCDLTKPTQVKNLFNDIDIVINAAAITSGSKDIVYKPNLHVTDNVIMNSNILREVYENRSVKHFIFFSCTVMYQSSKKKQNEKMFNYKIVDKYFGIGWTKVYVEKLCEFYSNLINTKFTVIRHSNIYGPHDKFDLKKSHVIGATITKVMKAKKEVEIWGKGNEIRDFIYISDLINFIKLTIRHQKTKFKIYNCGSGEGIEVLDLVNLIIKVSQKKLIIKKKASAPYIDFNLILDSKKAKNELGWVPSVNLKQGLKKTIDWWKLNFND